MKRCFSDRKIVFTFCLAILLSLSFYRGIDARAEKISENGSLLQVIVSGIDASSYIRGKDPNAYAPVKMMDGNEETSWQFSTKYSELKETYVYISFVNGVQVDQLWIKNGFWKNTDGKDQYTRNSRVKGISVFFRYSGSTRYTDRLNFKLNDDLQRKDWQKLNLGRHDEVTGIRLRINSIYQGSKYATDVCISEMMVVAQINGKYDSSQYCTIGSNVLVYEKPSSPQYALATNKLATRSGPGTEYTEKGTYNVAGQMIQILAKAYDINNVCWVQCRIPYHNRYVTAWTGWKRFDHSSLDISLVPLVSALSYNDDETGILDNESDNMTGGTADPGNNGEEDEMIGNNSDPNGFISSPDTDDDIGANEPEEIYSSRNPRGTLKILSRNDESMKFEFQINHVALFKDLSATFETSTHGSFAGYGDWNISGSFIMSGSLIILYLDNTPNLYSGLSAHEFIGAGTLVFELDKPVTK